jgi:hypothetical protein
MLANGRCRSRTKANLLDLEIKLKYGERQAELKAVGQCCYRKDHIECGHFCDIGCSDDFEKIVSL